MRVTQRSRTRSQSADPSSDACKLAGQAAAARDGAAQAINQPKARVPPGGVSKEVNNLIDSPPQGRDPRPRSRSGTPKWSRAPTAAQLISATLPLHQSRLQSAIATPPHKVSLAPPSHPGSHSSGFSIIILPCLLAPLQTFHMNINEVLSV